MVCSEIYHKFFVTNLNKSSIFNFFLDFTTLNKSKTRSFGKFEIVGTDPLFKPSRDIPKRSMLHVPVPKCHIVRQYDVLKHPLDQRVGIIFNMSQENQ